MKRQEAKRDRTRAALLGLWRRWRELKSRLRGGRFACRSLAGEAPDGLFVNSDMSVSCNCQDIDGQGQLGNLRESPFEEILAGPRAARLRGALAAGRLPLLRCAACWHLQSVSSDEAEARRDRFVVPSGLSVENTVRCNLHCVSCCRQQILATRKAGQSLSLGDVEIVARTLQRIGANYCGYYNLGEPFVSDAIRDELQLIRQYNPRIKILISTNGALLNTEAKREAALLVDDLLFSIDGVNSRMVRTYQRGGDFDRSYENMKALVALRDARGQTTPRIYWKYVVFRWNDSSATVRRAVELARAAGVDCLQFLFARNPWYGMSWRFFLSPTFHRLGQREGWRFRNLWFREPQGDLSPTAGAASKKISRAA